jgi:hypothetical protein
MKTILTDPEFLLEIKPRCAHETELLDKDMQLLRGSHGGVLTEDGAVACFQPDKKDGRARALAAAAAFVRFFSGGRVLRIQVITDKVEDHQFWFRTQ